MKAARCSTLTERKKKKKSPVPARSGWWKKLQQFTRTLWHMKGGKIYHPAQVQTWNFSTRESISMKVFQLSQTFHSTWVTPIKTPDVSQPESLGAIMSCRVASHPCCCRWDVEVHLRRKQRWVQLSMHSYLIRTKMTPRGEKVLMQQFNTKTSYLLLFHQVSWNVTPALPQESEDVSRWLYMKSRCVTRAGSSLLYLPDRRVRSSCAGSCSRRCVGRTAPRSHTRRSLCSRARNDLLCSLEQNQYCFRKLHRGWCTFKGKVWLFLEMRLFTFWQRDKKIYTTVNVRAVNMVATASGQLAKHEDRKLFS